MGKETGLPKNIRQIGEIDEDKKICLEDYVMTYIRKKEQQESFLGVFLGERREEEGETFLYIRGILEAAGETKEEMQKKIEEQKKEYFPDWGALGCCVIGAYPAGLLEQLSAALPEAGTFIYHLQEQEETLYWKEGEKYRSLKGYFVFYEQNRRMQEYLSDVFPDDRVEKESLPDKAIKTFRQKIEGKDQKRMGSFLKIASSFFVVTVLVIGTIVVNRLDEIRSASKTGSAGTAENEVVVIEDEPQNVFTEKGEEAAASVLSGETGESDGTEAQTDVSAVLEQNTAEEISDPLSEAADVFSEESIQEDLRLSQAGETLASESSQTETQTASDETEGAALAESGTSAQEASAAVRQTTASYVIKEGDTLADICTKYYGSLDRLEDICQINEITDANLVVPGQKIVLP